MEPAGTIAMKMMTGAGWRNTAPQAGEGEIRPMRPVRLADLDLSHHPLVGTAVAAARTWAARYRDGDSRAPSIVFSGGNGTGKTHLARAIWWSVTQVALDSDGVAIPGSRRPIGRFLQAADLIALLSHDEESGQAPGVGYVIGAAPLLVIDDVGAEGVIPYVADGRQEHERHVRYFRVIDWAGWNDVPVIITTNLKFGALAAHIGPRAWDRLNQMAPAGQMCSLWGVPSWRVKEGGRS